MARIGRAPAKFADESGVASPPHSGVQVDDVQQWIGAEALKQAEHVYDREAALAAVHQLHGAAILQIDARDNHGIITV